MNLKTKEADGKREKIIGKKKKANAEHKRKSIRALEKEKLEMACEQFPEFKTKLRPF